MTDAIISVVVEQFASFVQQEVKLVLSVRKDVNALTSTLQTLQAVLRDAEARQIKEEAVRLWLDKLKAIVYDVEDVLDEWNTRNHQPLIQGVNDDDDVHPHKKVFFCCLSPCFSTRSVVMRYNIGNRIKDIRERLDDVANEKEKFKLNESQIQEETRERLTYSMIDVPNTYGREQAKNDLVNLLLCESSAQAMNPNVISIVGTGGFGKTTLANLVRADDKVEEIFEKRIFVCVSEPFQLLKVARSIIEQIDGKAPSVNGSESVLQCLCENLKGKRFLIVLDDVWTEDTNDWDPLKLAFKGGAQGSWVIITTRSKKVAEMMHSNHIHNLAELSDRDSWLLFEHIAFAGRQEELSKFEEIGKKIAAKCKGVPLVIRIVGSHMHSIKTKNEWNSVLTSKVWEIEEIEKKISSSFFLSYNPLPSKLKQCFMYCAIFPKDTRLCKDELVKLWMAQGFLGSGGHKNLEKTGCNYFDDLAMHSFFQDFWKDPEENITYCKMHDLVHDFAQFLTEGECSFLEDGEELDGINVRHLFTKSLESPSIFMAKNLRTLLITKSVNSDQLIKIFNQLKCIRILDLSDSGFEELPRQVKKLLHLRYLDLSGTELMELPETICHLFNLQTLKLNHCPRLVKLPNGIGNLLNLRHLELKYTYALNCMPRGIGRLRYLRSLCKFIVGNASNECKISELKDLRYLKGRSLQIIGLERVIDASEAAQAELKNKSIVVLSLEFERLEEGESEKMTSVLENLQPHEDVEELNIYRFRGSRFPSWISNRSMLANLLRLTLSEFDYTIKLPALGNLALLEELTLKGMKSVKHIGREFYGLGVAFPKLKKLEISEMNELVEWEVPIARDNKKIMPCLSVLKLRNCPMLRALPGLGTLESLDSLRMFGLPSIKQVGYEFLGISAGDEFGGGEGEGEKGSSSSSYVLKPVILFPKLSYLRLEVMNEWEVWILAPFQEDIQIMPRLTNLHVSWCPKLRALPSWISANISMLANLLRLTLSECDYTTKLPALGNLASLEELTLKGMKSVKRIDSEFYGFDDHNDTSNPGAMDVAFPKLKKLEIKEMNELVEWELPIARDNKKIMPCLSVLELRNCPMLRALPGFGTLESLESLGMFGLPSIKEVGLEFLGISAGDEFGGGEGEGEGEKGIVPNNLRNICSAERKGSDKRGGGSLLFPKLTKLMFRNMKEWEVWILPPFQEDIQIMPRLTNLDVRWCPKLRALPDLTRFKSLEILFFYNLDAEGLVELEREEDISLPCLRELSILFCTNLRVIPGYLFPHTLRKLDITNCPQQLLRWVQPCLPPLLESLQISHSKHPSLPKGFNHLTAIQYLLFYNCESLDFDLNELKHLTKLQRLIILKCPILAKRFQSSGDDWMTILSHVPNISIDSEYIKGS